MKLKKTVLFSLASVSVLGLATQTVKADETPSVDVLPATDKIKHSEEKVSQAEAKLKDVTEKREKLYSTLGHDSEEALQADTALQLFVEQAEKLKTEATANLESAKMELKTAVKEEASTELDSTVALKAQATTALKEAQEKKAEIDKDYQLAKSSLAEAESELAAMTDKNSEKYKELVGEIEDLKVEVVEYEVLVADADDKIQEAQADVEDIDKAISQLETLSERKVPVQPMEKTELEKAQDKVDAAQAKVDAATKRRENFWKTLGFTSKEEAEKDDFYKQALAQDKSLEQAQSELDAAKEALKALQTDTAPATLSIHVVDTQGRKPEGVAVDVMVNGVAINVASTDKDGKVLVRNLKEGDQVSYRLASVPVGFELPVPGSVKLNSGENQVTISVTKLPISTNGEANEEPALPEGKVPTEQKGDFETGKANEEPALPEGKVPTEQKGDFETGKANEEPALPEGKVPAESKEMNTSKKDSSANPARVPVVPNAKSASSKMAKAEPKSLPNTGTKENDATVVAGVFTLVATVLGFGYVGRHERKRK